jgi:hypothetical protein
MSMMTSRWLLCLAVSEYEVHDAAVHVWCVAASHGVPYVHFEPRSCGSQVLNKWPAGRSQSVPNHDHQDS